MSASNETQRRGIDAFIHDDVAAGKSRAKQLLVLAEQLTRPVRSMGESAEQLTRPVRSMGESTDQLTRPVRSMGESTGQLPQMVDFAESQTRRVSLDGDFSAADAAAPILLDGEWSEHMQVSKSDRHKWYAAEADLIGVPIISGREQDLHFDGAARDASLLDVRSSLWRAASEGDPDAAAALIRASVRDPDPWARAAACTAVIALDSIHMTDDQVLSSHAFSELSWLSRSTRHQARQIARTVVEQLDGSAGLLGHSTPPTHASTVGSPNNHQLTPPGLSVSVGVHGTFSHFSTARKARPLHPSHAFHAYLETEHAPDLFNNVHHSFSWEGRYTRASRDAGADDLGRWASQYAPSGLRVVFAHSHGGNVALTAAARGLRIDRLILLSTPAIQRTDAEWNDIDTNVGRVVAYRTHLDGVILTDQLLSRIPWSRLDLQASDGLDFPRNVNIVQPFPIGWLGHTSWLQERVWRKRGIHGSVKQAIIRR